MAFQSGSWTRSNILLLTLANSINEHDVLIGYIIAFENNTDKYLLYTQELFSVNLQMILFWKRF